QVTVNQPLADRNANVVVPDGSGGWFIGGLMRIVDGVSRQGIAHILSDGTLDLEWNATLNSTSIVNSIAVLENEVYVGGTFTSAGGITRNRIVKLNKTTAAVDLDWNPDINGTVNTITISGSDIYVGGSFTTVGGITRNSLVKLNNTSGAVDISWNPNSNGVVQKIAISGDDIYVGGTFTSVGGQTRNRLAKLNNSTGEADASWDPNADAAVQTLAIADNGIYVGGSFTSLGGESFLRLAKLNNTTGEVDPSWNPGADASVNSIEIAGSDIYVGGAFTTIAGQSRNRLVKLNNITGIVDPNWDPKADNTVNSIAISGIDVFFGGNFTVLKDITRNRVTRISKITNEIDPDWDPNVDNYVNTIAISGGDIYLGGRFTSVGGQSRNRLAKVNNTTGALDPDWNPNAGNTINTITISGSDIYVGGAFTTVGGQIRNRVAKLNNTSGDADSNWNPNANNIVQAIAISGDAIYLGGNFTTMGGQTRNRLAKISKTTGETDSDWNPNAGSTGGNSVSSIAISGDDIYVGGEFIVVGGQSRLRIAKLNNTTGVADAIWNPKASNTVSSIAISGSDIYVGGGFTTIGAASREKFAKLNNTDGAADPMWIADASSPPPSTGSVSTVGVSGNYIYAGGSFSLINGLRIPRFVVFKNSPVAPNAPTDLGAVRKNGAIDITFTAGSDGGGEISNYEYSMDEGDSWIPLNPTQTFSPITITGLDNIVSYTIQIRAVNATGEGTASSSIVVPALFAGGTGSTDDPYQIENWRQLNNIRENLGGYYLLNKNIDEKSTGYETFASASANDNHGWIPFGKFTGRFDGENHFIKGLTINRPETDYVGLFSETEGGQVNNLGLIDISIVGKDFVGGLIGSKIAGNFSKLYVTGSVSGVNQVGGLAGRQHSGGSLNNSYTDVEVFSSGIHLGGFIGLNNDGGTINTSYSVGKVTGSGSGIGGFTGVMNNGGRTQNCFWDTESSGLLSSAGGTGKSTAEMKTLTTFTDATWNFTASTGIWKIQAGDYRSYPYLQNFNYDEPEAEPGVNPIPGLVPNPPYAGGTGTELDPYQISDWRHLHNVRLNLSAYFVLNNNLDETSSGYDTYASATANENTGWLPIGGSVRFSGNFDGKNYTIKGLTINRSSTNDIGLFGIITGSSGSNIVLKNVGLIDVSIIGNIRAGGLIGQSISYVEISGVYVTGTVKGVSDIGGLIGRTGIINISNSYTDVAVEASHITAPHVGGFVGRSTTNSIIRYSYSKGFVKSPTTNTTGGFIGSGIATVSDSYWDTETSGMATSARGTGKITAEMRTQSTFSGWDFTPNTGIWNIKQAGTDEGLMSYPYLQGFEYDEPETNPEFNPIPGLAQITLPELTTATPLDVTTVSATLGGEVTSDGGAVVTDRGIVWSQSSNPTISDTKVEMESGTGTFSGTVTGLLAGSTVYVRAYATNSIGTAYGEEVFFDTQSPSPPSFNSSPITTIPYDKFYNYTIEGSVENDLETTISSPTLPAWLSFSAGESGVASLAGTLPDGIRLRGATADNDGNIYTIRTDGTQIFKITPDGTSASWRSGIRGDVFSLHIANGYLYISRNNNISNAITRVPLNNPSAEEEVFLSRSGGVISLIDKDGFIYAANYPSSEILKINETTKEVSVVLSDLFSNSPFGLTIDKDNNLFFAAHEINSILKYDGIELITVLSDLPTGPTSITTDNSGNFYISMENGGIRKYNSDFSSFEVVSVGATDDIWSLSLSSSGLLVYAKVNTNEVYRLQTRDVLTGTPAKSDVGNHPVTLRATNDAGFTDQEFTITVTDETGPVVSTFAPTHNATEVEFKPSLFITFDEEVVLGNTGILTVNSGSTILRQYDLSVPADRDEIGVSDDHLILSIDLDISLPFNTDITVGISTGFVEDQAGNEFEGFIPESNTWKFTTINKLNQTITFSEIDPKTYGDAIFTLGDTETDQGLTVTYTADDPSIVTISGNQATVLKAGSTTITASQAGDDVNFAAEPVERTLTVNKAALIVTADLNQGKLYGTAEPVLTFTATGFVNEDDESIISGTLIRVEGEEVGAYAISQGTLSAGNNYSIEFTGDDFNITPATITGIEFNDNSFVF
ncbi:MAG: hypothetical protein EA341_08285, partial [Mongoliibacter sp.]|uniref:MBG domain-containing protein n=1 Tax=Mongoliibacter sp. TaxID=2022438 RepID=UPI0012F075E2